MPPESNIFVESDHSNKILAIMEQWEKTTDCHVDNTYKYFLLLLFKLGLDAAVFHLCSRKWHAYFFGMCSFSIVLVDLALTLVMGAVCLLGPEMSFVSPCFLLANASAAYGTLPLPMLVLGFLDYCFESTCTTSHRPWFKTLRNAVLALLMWVLAVTHSFNSAAVELMELEYVTGKRALVCETMQATLISYFVSITFILVVFALVPFWSRIPRWMREADKLCISREDQEIKKSDFLFTAPPCKDTTSCEMVSQEPPPPLWLSLTLGFATFWMPFLIVSVTCLILGFEVPAYISVNLLWLECANSLIVGLMFWAQSETQGPYNRLPENVCLWPVYWHLSKGTQQHPQPIAVSSPTTEKKNTYFYV